jgi:hypothetical protein
MVLNLHHSCSFTQKFCAYDFLCRSGRTTWRSEDLRTERTDGQWDLAFRLYRRVIEIDDGRPLLRPRTAAELIANQNMREQVYPTTAADAGEP